MAFIYYKWCHHMPSSKITLMFFSSVSRRRRGLDRNDAEILTLELGSLHSLFTSVAD